MDDIKSEDLDTLTEDRIKQNLVERNENGEPVIDTDSYAFDTQDGESINRDKLEKKIPAK